jgi:hypothetical protein
MLLCATSTKAQFFISSNSELHVGNGRMLYFDKNIENEGLIQFASDGELILDQGLDNSSGSLTLNNAILKLGSGTSNADNNHILTFNNSDDAVNFVELNHNGIYNVTSTGFLKVIKTFTSYSGTLNANDRIVLKSGTIMNGDYPASHDPSVPPYPNTAIVPESTGGTVNGIRVERYFPGNRAWRFLSSPIDSDQSIYDNWQNSGVDIPFIGTHITGGSIGNGFDQNGSGSPSLYIRDNSNQSWNTLPNTNATDLEIGQNYYTLVRGDRSVDLQINDFNTEPPTVLRSTGSIHIGDLNVAHTLATSDFFVAANPYQAPVDMSEVRATSSNSFKNEMWVWQPEANNAGQYAHVLDLSTGTNSIPGLSHANQFLQPSQAVFLQASGNNPTINFREAHKSDDSNLTDVFNDNTLNNFLRIGLYGTNQTPLVDVAHDGLVMLMNNNYNTLSDIDDGEKFFNNEENIGIQYGNAFLTTDKRSEPTDLDEIVDLFFTNITEENYNFSIELIGFDNLPNGLFLWDKYQNTYTPLVNGLIIPLNFDQSIPETLDQNRFAITFKDQTLNADQFNLNAQIEIFPNAFDDEINISLNDNFTDIDLHITIFDVLGRKIFTRHIKEMKKNIRLKDLKFSSGNYLLNFKSKNHNQTFKIVKK